MPAAAFVAMAKDARLVSRGAAQGVEAVGAAREAANTVLWQVRRGAYTAHSPVKGGSDTEGDVSGAASAAESSAGEEARQPATRDMAAISTSDAATAATATGSTAPHGIRVPDAVLRRLRQRCVRARAPDKEMLAPASPLRSSPNAASSGAPLPSGLSAHGFTCALVALVALTRRQQQQQRGSPPPSPSRAKRYPPLAAALDTMLQRHLLQHAKQKASASEFRRQLLRRDVREAMGRHGSYLKSVFAHYAAADASTAAARQQSKSLNVQEFLLLLEHCKLLGGALSREAARRVFFSVQVVR